ncbi:MAG: tRNA (adenosine(37)-N6)-dimethylallyltransferase MiaA [Clostridiales bacterium]|nr:tRNA (adenosine(37)-N6)-dimethylallyltransferase MiaA [Clostridiales bacterium]
MNKVLVICGATASGKTSLAVDCALKLNTQVISADSQLIYRGLDIGTAKPTEAEKRGVKHHLIDIVEPNESFSVSDYKNAVLPVLNRLLSEGKTPIICGGTGFYINSLLFDLSYGNVAANGGIREKYAKILEEDGAQALYERLKSVDAETAQKLHVNDTKRIIRALEIYEVSGKKKSEQNDSLTPVFDYTAVAINYPREELYSRIDKRVDEMFERGLVEEVQKLLKSGIDENCQCMQAIGYKEVVFGLKNGSLNSTMRDIIKLNTRHYAKRQITFFKKLQGIHWLEPQEGTADKVAEILNND